MRNWRGIQWRIGSSALLLWFCLGAGTVAEQRARLPPPATCADPVVGVWKSHTFTQAVPRWDEFHLQIERVEGSEDKLTGTILNHAWYGDSKQVQPPVDCTGDRNKFSTDGAGSESDLRVVFGGIGTPRMDHTYCGPEDHTYNLDHFSGIIDPELQEFQTLNNDGGVHVNFPVVFRRISCTIGVVAPDPPVSPPPFQPPSSGCMLW